MFLRTLRHRATGFANVTTRQILDHLYANDGKLSPADLQDNDSKMRTTYDPNQPIETFFDQIEDAVTLADAAKAPYTEPQIIAIAYNTIFTTSMFPEACREWRRRPIIEHTWSNFKAAFAEAHQDFRESQVTSQQSGYHNANAAFELQQDTATAIANLATATAADRSTFSNLTATNSILTNELAQNKKMPLSPTQKPASKH